MSRFQGIVVGVLLLAGAAAQQKEESRPQGAIHGIVISRNGQPVERIGLTAEPLGVALGARLPYTRTNEAGEYRFENVPWWGRYTVYAEDEEAGYSRFSTGAAGDNNPTEVEVTPEHPEGELNVVLPPKAGFIHIQLTNQKTGRSISAMRVALMTLEKPTTEPLFTMSCESTQVILVPPNTNFLLHVTSDGFREWDESIGKGKLIHLASGANSKLDVQLVPSE